jgi:hypothetical protein
MSIPKWAKADPDIAKTTANANTVTSLVFIFSSSFPLWVFAAKQKKPRVLGAFLAPDLRGLCFLLTYFLKMPQAPACIAEILMLNLCTCQRQTASERRPRRPNFLDLK